MSKRAGAFKSDKRRKEVSRQKKQEEKRQKRFKKEKESQQESEVTVPEGTDTETADTEAKE